MTNKIKIYKKSTPKVFIKTFGCQMNVRDSEIVRGMLEEEGYLFINDAELADIVIFNTCSVRQHAEDRAVNTLRLLLKNSNRDKIFGLIGCIAQHRKDELFKKLTGLNFICGPSDIYKIPKLLNELLYKNQSSEIKKIQLTTETQRPLDNINPTYRESKAPAFVNISYGCSNFCSYCIVPYVRGPLVSRPPEDILEEIEDLVRRNITSIVLLGQNVNSYFYNSKKYKKVDFIKLLKLVYNIDGIEKINFITNHPKDVNLSLFKTIAQLPKIERYLHLPLQSGSNRILNLMNRGYTIEKYKKLIEEYRKICFGKLSTDIIVGFPTEEDKDFELTKQALIEIEFDNAYIFKYSPRPPAKSAQLFDNVPLEIKKRRHKILLDLQKKISFSKNK